MPNLAVEHLVTGDMVTVGSPVVRRVTESVPRCGALHGQDSDFWFLSLDIPIAADVLPPGMYLAVSRAYDSFYVEVRRGTLVETNYLNPDRRNLYA